MSIERKAVKGGVVTAISQSLRFLARIASISIIARFVSPEEYGIVAIATSITFILQVFREAGLSTAIIQKPQVNQEELSTIFWCNVALGIIAFLISIAASPIAASAYEQKELLLLLPAFGSLGLLASLNVQKVSLLLRELRFEKIAVADLISQLIGIGVGIGFAVRGFGYWSLFAMEAASTVMFNLIIRFQHPWKTSFYFNFKQAKPMITYGVGIMGSQIVDRIEKSLTPLIIGLFLGTNPVGIYNRSQGILNMPMRNLITPLVGVARAFIFRTTDEQEKFTSGVTKILNIILLAGSLIMIGSLVCTELIVSILLGQQWTACIPIFMAMAPLALIEPSMSFLSTVLISKGKSRNLFWFSLASILVIGATLLTAAQFSLFYIALAYTLTGLLIRFPILIRLTGKSAGIPVSKLLNCFIGPVTASIPAIGLGLWAFFNLDTGAPEIAVASLLASLAVFFSIYSLFPTSRQTLSLLLGMITSRRRKRSGKN